MILKPNAKREMNTKERKENMGKTKLLDDCACLDFAI